MTAAEFVDHLQARGLTVKPAGDGQWQAQCPAHEDRMPSLSIGTGRDGQPLLTCHAGCEIEAVAAAAACSMADLFVGDDARPQRRTNGKPASRPDELPSKEALDTWRQRLAGNAKLLERLHVVRGWTPDALTDLALGWDGKRVTIPVENAEGELVNLLRYLPGERPNGERKMLALKGRPRDLWPRPESTSGDVWLVEGEPDAITLRAIGLQAVAIPGVDSAKHAARWAPRFDGRRAVVCFDCDAPGRKAAGLCGAALLGHAAEVRVLDLDKARSDGYDLGDLCMELGPEAGALLVEMAAAVAPMVAAESEPEPGARRLILTPASEIAPERVRWLWDDRLPLRGLSLIAGEPGLGKSTLTIELAARVSRGELDGELHGQAHDVLIATAEDHWASVVLGRLRAAGADLARVHRVTMQERDIEAQLTLPDDVAAIEAALLGLASKGNPVGLVIVDPVGAYIASAIDTHRDAAVRRVLAPLAALSERHRLSVAGVAHMNKSDASKLLTRVGGSVAFGAAPRSVLVFARHPEDAAGELGSERVIVHAKSNQGRYATTLAARIDGSEIEDIGSVSQLVILGECDVGPEDLARTGDTDRSDRASAAEWLEDELADGTWHEARAVKAAAKTAGIAERTLHRAREQLDVEVQREGFPAVAHWRLPVVPPPPSPVGTTASGTTAKPPVNTEDSAASGAQLCHIPESGTTGAKSAPDGLEDLGPEQPQDDLAATALKPASCTCERPLPAPDDGQLRCAHCGHEVAGWTGADQ